jgi:hypothetical protein
MALGVLFEGGFEFDVFPVRAVLGYQGRPLFLGEFKRETGSGLQESRVTVRDVVKENLRNLTEWC